MRMVDLRKGVIYAWKTGYSSDIRRLENFVKVEYVGPAPAQYDRYRPDKKMNKGRVRVKLLQEHRAFERWGNDNPEVQKIGTVVEIDAKAILISWDDMVEAAGETHAAALQVEAYMKSLVDLAAIKGKITAPQYRILWFLVGYGEPKVYSWEKVAEHSQQSATSSGFVNNVSVLRSMGLLRGNRGTGLEATTILFLDGHRS